MNSIQLNTFMPKRTRSYGAFKPPRKVQRTTTTVTAGTPGRFIGPANFIGPRNNFAGSRAWMAVPGYTRTSGSYGRYSGPGAEAKFFDTAVNFTFDSTMEVPATGQLNIIPQGDGPSSRDGRNCVITSIQLRGYIAFNPGAAATATTLTYLYLVLDKQCNGAAAAVTDVFTSATGHTALINLDNNQRFTIIKKWIWQFNSNAGVTTAFNAESKKIEYYKKVNIPITWDNSFTTGVIGTIRSNNIFLIAGNSATLGDDQVGFNGVCRLRFKG